MKRILTIGLVVGGALFVGTFIVLTTGIITARHLPIFIGATGLLVFALHWFLKKRS